MNMNQPILRIENLSHRYSSKWAVKDFNLEITKKGIYGLLGANGAGKSTIMNIVCGVLKQTNGVVEICGINSINDSVNSRKKIGFLPQKPPLHLELTVVEYLELCAKLRMIPSKHIKQAVLEVLETCHLKHMKDRLISNLSGGYQQRVGIAQAIIHKPEVVVFDEPTNGLDPNQILEIRTLIRDIAKESTIILSTHILSEVQATCDRIIMLNQGGLVFDGSVEDFDNYISPDSIFVTLRQMPPIELIKELDYVINVDIIDNVSYRIYSSNSKETIKQLVKKSVENNWDLEKVYDEHRSMDDVFALLSGNDNKNKV